MAPQGVPERVVRSRPQVNTTWRGARPSPVSAKPAGEAIINRPTTVRVSPRAAREYKVTELRASSRSAPQPVNPGVVGERQGAEAQHQPSPGRRQSARPGGITTPQHRAGVSTLPAAPQHRERPLPTAVPGGEIGGNRRASVQPVKAVAGSVRAVVQPVQPLAPAGREFRGMTAAGPVSETQRFPPPADDGHYLTLGSL